MPCAAVGAPQIDRLVRRMTDVTETNRMDEGMFRIAGVILGCGVGAGSGWAASRIFTRSILQDFSATLIGWLLGSIMMVAAEVAAAMSQSAAGLGAVSVGLSEVVPFGLPIAVLLAVAARWVRRRSGRTSVVPIVLGASGALLGALWVTMTISVSNG